MKKRALKWVALLSVLVLFIGVVAGCGSDSKPEGNSAETKSSLTKNQDDNKTKGSATEKTKIVWWTHQRHDMDYMSEVVENFMAENPDIEVEYVIQSDNYDQNLDLSFQSAQSPDVFSIKDVKYAAERDMAEPLDDMITEEQKELFGDLLYMNLVNTYDGKLYTLPNTAASFRYVYNKDLMDKAGITKVPETLSEMVEAAKLMTKAGAAEGQYGFAINLKTAAGAAHRSIDKIAEASGIHPYDFTKGKYDYSVMAPILSAYKEMYDTGAMFPGVEALSMDPLRSQFAEGKIGSYISADWEVGVYAQQFPTEVNWSAAPVPVVDGYEGQGKTGICFGGKWQAISKQSEHKEEAFRFLSYLYSERVLLEYANKGLGNPMVPAIAKQVTGGARKNADKFAINEKLDRIWEATPMQFAYNTSYGLKPEGMTDGEVFSMIIIGALDMQEGLDDLTKRYNAAYDKAIANGDMERIIIKDFDPTK